MTVKLRNIPIKQNDLIVIYLKLKYIEKTTS